MSQSDVRQGQSFYLTHHTAHGWTATPLPLVKKEPFEEDLDQSGPDGGGGSPMSSPTPHSSPDHSTTHGDLVMAEAATSAPYAEPSCSILASSSSSSSSSSTSPTYRVRPRRAADTNFTPSSDIKSCFQCGRIHSPCWRRGPNRTMRKGKEEEEEANDREAMMAVGLPGRARGQIHIHSTTAAAANPTLLVNEAAQQSGHDQGRFTATPPVAPYGGLFSLMSLFPPLISSATTPSPSPASAALPSPPKPAWPTSWPSPAQPSGLASLFPAAAVPTHHSSTLANAASSLLHLATGAPPSTATTASSLPVASPSPSTTTTATTTSSATSAHHQPHHLPPSPAPEPYAALTSAATTPAGPTGLPSKNTTLADCLAFLFAQSTAAYLSLVASVTPRAALPSPPAPVPATTEVGPATADLQQLSQMLQQPLRPPPPGQHEPPQHQKHQKQHSELQQRLRQLQLQLPTLLPAAKVHQPPQPPPPPPQPQPPVVPVDLPTLTLPPLSSLCDIFRPPQPQPQPQPQPHQAPLPQSAFPPPVPPKAPVAAPRAPPHQAKFVALQAALRSSVPGLQHRQRGLPRPASPSSASSPPPSAPPFPSSSLTSSAFPLTMKCSPPSPPPSSSAAAVAFKLGRGKRKMKTYTCRTCQLPKKGHICPSPLTDASSPASSPPSSPRATSPAKKRRRNNAAPAEASKGLRGAGAAPSPSPSSLPTVTFVSRAFSWSSRDPKSS